MSGYYHPYKPKTTPHWLVVDLEGYRDYAENRMEPYLVGVYDGAQAGFWLFKNDGCVSDFIDRFLTNRYRSHVFYSHFGSLFDFPLILDELNKRPRFNIYPIMRGSKIIKMTVDDKYNHQWYFNDSGALLNFSLDKLTKAFNVSHKKLEVVKKDENYDRKLYDLYCKDPKTVIEYLYHDCAGLYEVLTKFKQEMLDVGGAMGLTMPATAMKTFNHGFQSHDLYMCSKELNDELRKALYGGRTEIFRMVAPEKEDGYYYYYDVNSLYPSVMRDNPYPISRPELDMTPDKKTFLENDGITYAKVESPQNIYAPLLPSKIKIGYDCKLMFVSGAFEGWWDNAFLKKAWELGYGIEPKKSYLFHTEYIFKEYVDRFYKIKQDSVTGTPQYMIAKLLMNCFSSDTNIYTDHGIQNIKDVKIGERVYSIDPKTLKVTLQSVIKTWRYKYNGKMLSINKKNVNFMVTPNHRFLLKRWWDDYKFYESTDVMACRTSLKFPPFSVISGRKRKSIKIGKHIFDFNDWLEFIGWYISEGALYRWSKNSASVRIYQKVYKTEIRKLLIRMGFKDVKKSRWHPEIKTYHESSSVFSINDISMHDWLLDNCKKYSENKRVPSFVFQYDPTHLEHLYKSLMLGDGSDRPHQMKKYTTTSLKLAEDFSRLCLHLGKKTRIHEEITIRYVVYRVYIYDHLNTTIRLTTRDKSWKNYDGYVYCLSLKKNNTILAGRNNSFEFVGQSLFGKFGQRQIMETMIKDPFPDPDEYTVTEIVDEETGWCKVEQEGKGKFYLPQIAIHVTALAQLKLYSIFEAILDKGYNLYYCDTDSVTTDYANMHVSTKLGDLKREKLMVEGYFLLPKTYKIVSIDEHGKKETELRAKGYSWNLQKKIAPDAFERAIYEGDTSGFKVISDRKEMLRAVSAFRRYKDFNRLDYIRRSIQTSYNKRKILKDFNTRAFDVEELI